MCWKDTDNTEKEGEGEGEGRRRYSDNTTNSMYPFLIHSFHSFIDIDNTKRDITRSKRPLHKDRACAVARTTIKTTTTNLGSVTWKLLGGKKQVENEEHE